MNKTLFLLFIFILIPVGISEAQVGTPDSSDADLNLSIAPVSQSSQSDDIVTLTANATGDNPLTFSWSQIYDGSPIVRLQNADSAVASFRIPYAVIEQAATLSFSVSTTDGQDSVTETIDVPVTLTVKPPIVVPPRELTPGVAEMIFFEQQWDDTDRWTLDDSWNIASPTDTLPVDTNNRVISIGGCEGSCPLQMSNEVKLSTHDGADLLLWVWFGDQIANTDSLNIETAATLDGTWENRHAINVDQSTHQRWFPVTINLDDLAGSDFFLRLTPSLEGDDGIIQIDAVQLIAKINDNVKPEISNVPKYITQDTFGPSVVTFARPTAVDNVDGPVAVECDAPSGVVYPFGTTTVTCRSEDSVGNTASVPFDITLNLYIPLEITAPDDLTLEATGELTLVDLGTATLNRDAAITNDAPDLFTLGNTTITWTAQDDKGTAEDVQVITIQDTTDPVITPPGDVTLEATGILSMINLGTATATDTVDAMPTITSDAPTSFPIGVTIVTYTATDDSGNSVTAIQNITIRDTGPMLILPFDVTAEATGVLTSVDIGTATVNDNIDSITATNDAPDSYPLGENKVTWTAEDSSGNTVTAVQKVTIQDTTNPYFDTPESYNVFAEATGTFTPVELDVIPAHDIVDPDVTVTNDAPDSFPIGFTFVIWTATDSSGNTAQYKQVVAVNDSTKPTITVPDDITIEASNLLTMINLGTATATDIVDAMPTITSDAPTSFPVGVTIVTYTATDYIGNYATGIQKVTVRDTTEPMLILPSDITAEATGALTSVDIGTAAVNDNVDSITATNNSPDSFPLGETQVTWTAKDNANNVATAIQTVTIRDTTNPTITVPNSIITEATDILTAVDIGSATASDIADSNVTITNDAPDSFPADSTIITWTATDDSGNTASDTQTVRIRDTTKPVFTSFPDDITVISANNIAVEFEIPTASDIFPVTVQCDEDSGALFPVGITPITCFAIDANNRLVRDSFSITVVASVSPDAPAALSASNIRAHDFVLNWSAPDLNGGTLLRYDILRDPPAPAFASTNNTTYTVTGLDPDTSSTYAVRAVTDGGQSPISNVVSVRTLSALPPGPIDDLSAVNITSDSLILEWTEPDLNGGALREYRLSSTSPHGNSTTQLALTTEPFYFVIDLQPDTQYSFSVEASNEAGFGQPSNIVDIITLELPLPDPVDDLRASDITHNSVRLKWSEPNLNGVRIPHYAISVYTGDVPKPRAYTSSPFALIGNLEPDTEYNALITARPANGEVDGNIITFTTLPRPVNDLTVSEITTESLTLSWTQPVFNNSTLQTYHILSASPHGTPTTILANTTNTSYTVSDLMPHIAYSFSVRTVTNQGATSESGNIINTRTLLIPPESGKDLVVTNITSNSIRLEWTQLDLNNGTLLEYRLLSTSPHSDPATQLALTTEPFYEVTDLTPNTDYSFRVQAITEDGYSVDSTILDTATLPLDTTNPVFTSFPDDITVKSKNSVSIEFASPTATDLYPVTILCSHNSGDLFSIGSTLVTCTATDTSDNSVQDSFIVTVNAVTGFETITDDFENLDSWEVYDPVGTWAHNGSRGFNNYTVAVTATDGNPAPSVLITGNGAITGAGIHRYFSLENHDSNDPLYISIDYNVSSDYSFFADIVNLVILNTDGKRLLTDRLSPSPHYRIGSGWDTRNIDISQYVSGQDDIEVRLHHQDFSSTDLHQVVSFDNFYLGTNPLPSRSISGEADIQLTPLQEPLQISQYHQTQICELIELQDESSDLYYYMLDLIRAYNMTATC